MNAPKIKLPYARPELLSDPYFDNAPHNLRTILAKADDDLEWHEYQTILGPHCPAGTYEESAYFLPLAFEYLQRHDRWACDLSPAIVGFASENHEPTATYWRDLFNLLGIAAA